ncbi:MAG: trimeric intracellular cation channel family protein [Clostridia bacterium]|nr:trimeric intracellular cation channel family protein [Clostridia bacterium]
MEITDFVFSLTEMIGTISFAVSGAMIAIARKLDAFGVLALGMVTAFGGGAVRDLLIGYVPPRCFYSFRLLAAAFVSALAVFVVAYILREHYFRREKLIDNINNIVDSVGLAAFTVSGIQAAITAGEEENPYFCVFLGMLTGVGGGILRDCMSRTIPLVFTKRVYATASIIGGAVYYALLHFECNGTAAAAIAMILIVLIRICATVFHWSLPKISLHEENEKANIEK